MLRSTYYLRLTTNDLRLTTYDLRLTTHNLRRTTYDLQLTICLWCSRGDLEWCSYYVYNYGVSYYHSDYHYDDEYYYYYYSYDFHGEYLVSRTYYLLLTEYGLRLMTY